MRDLYRRMAEAYLQNKKAKGEPLPGIRGRLNYRGVAAEMKIPYRQFLPGSELRLLVEASLDELRVSNDSLHEQPRRVIKPKVSTFSTTYGDLKAGGRVWLGDQGYSEKSIPSYLSLLNVYMRYLGRKDEDSTAQDFGTGFESRLYAFLKTTGKGDAAASPLRLWAKIQDELQQSKSLPAHFALALAELVARDGRSQVGIARAAGINKCDLSSYIKGDQKPVNREAVARLEEVLGVLPETLSSKLDSSTLRRVINIPKDWWPEQWRNYGNGKYQRDKVIDLIPDHLLAGPLEDLKPAFSKALEKVLAGGGQTAFQQKHRRLMEKPYALKFRNWSDRLKAEFADLLAYKTAPSGLRNRNRVGRWNDESAKAAQGRLETFFGFLCLPTDHPDSELRGLGLRPEDLTLAWLAVKEVMVDYLEFRFLRSGAHSHATEVRIATWGAMLRPESGWLWLRPKLLLNLPERQQRDVEAAGGWSDYCVAAHSELSEFLAILRHTNQIKQMRDPMLPIRPILDHPKPLSLVYKALALHRSHLEAISQSMDTPSLRLAMEWRDHLLISLLACFPLRAKHWGLLTYKEDGTGYLQNHPRDGWRLVIPYDDFKNVSNNHIFTSHSVERVIVLKFSDLPPLQRLIPLLEFYLKDMLPVIAGGSDFLFPTKNGRPTSPPLLYVQIRRWTRKYLSQASPRKLGITGVHPFGPHAFRDIVATHIIKTTGSIALAANILLDSEEMVRKHYARFLPEDRLKLAMDAFDIDEDEED